MSCPEQSYLEQYFLIISDSQGNVCVAGWVKYRQHYTKPNVSSKVLFPVANASIIAENVPNFPACSHTTAYFRKYDAVFRLLTYGFLNLSSIDSLRCERMTILSKVRNWVLRMTLYSSGMTTEGTFNASFLFAL